MKKLLLLSLSLIVLMTACSKKEESANIVEPDTTVAEESSAVVTDPIAEGKSLVEGADCLGCHKLDAKFTGPSYKEVAAKYENTPENVELLAQKIIDGGTGVWGNVPMTPHKGLSKENAKYMVQYILSQK